MGPLFYVLQPLAAAISSPHEICEHTMRERSGKLDYRGKNEYSPKKRKLYLLVERKENIKASCNGHEKEQNLFSSVGRCSKNILCINFFQCSRMHN
jgi:hypothetical protein